MQNYIAFAIPVFFVLIGLEWVVARLQRQQVYRLDDSINDLACGIIQQVFSAFMRVVVLGVYTLIYKHFGLFELGPGVALVWVAGYVGADFCYYWYHRAGHEVNFMWAAHIVHHQSEEYNYSVALRQSALGVILSAPFYWPLAVLGFHPVVFFACSSFVTLYQFWIHTRTIKRLGFLEWILVTPSHHRVHHARNPEYIDRNLGGTFIFWDKLFGTFQAEKDEPVYGITNPLHSWNPIWANFHYWRDLAMTARRCVSLKDKMLLFLKPPGWFPDYLGGYQAPSRPPEPLVKYHTPVSRGLSFYLVIQFVATICVSFWFILYNKQMSVLPRVLTTAFILVSLTTIGALFESKSWGFYLDAGRFLLLALPAAAVSGYGSPSLMVVGAATMVSLLWCLSVRPTATV